MPHQITARRLQSAAACALFLFIGVFILPYYFPVTPSVSLSYLVGFNNRVAAASFLLGAFGVAISLRGWIGESDHKDQQLPRWLLLASVLLSVCLGVGMLAHRIHRAAAGEARFFLDKIYQLSLHRVPYREFEFTYGPLLLYPPMFVHRFLGTSLVTAYYSVWVAFWAVGMGMFYFVIAKVDIPTRHRVAVYALAVIMTPSAMIAEGINYAPLRLVTTPFLALCLHEHWKRTKAPYQTACIGGVIAALAFAVSTEQAIGLLCGSFVYFLLLTFLARTFPLPALLLQTGLFLLIVVTASHFHLFESVKSFSKGGYNFPVLISPGNLLIIAVYVVGICVLWRAVITRDLQHNYVLLALCGLPMLPACMGRNDLGHMVSATSLYFVGLFAVFARTPLRRVLVPALSITILVACYGPYTLTVASAHRKHTSQPTVGDATATVSIPIPTNVVYYSPYNNAVSNSSPSYVPFPVDEGFYAGFQNITTEQQIADELAEFQRHKGMPFLLPDVPDATHPPLWDTDVNVLHWLELAPFVPTVKHAPINTQSLEDFLVHNYRPTPMAQDGERVWTYTGGKQP